MKAESINIACLSERKVSRSGNLVFQGISLFFFLLVGLSCKEQRRMPPAEYIRYLSSAESGLSISKQHRDLVFRARLQPPELLTLINSGETHASAEAFGAGYKEYAGQMNVIFLISDAGGHHLVKETVFDPVRYGQLLSYANTALQNDFELQLSDGSLIPCSMVHIEPANAVEPVIRVTLSFHHLPENPGDYTLVFNDNLFNTGKLKFLYRRNLFDQLPKLKI